MIQTGAPSKFNNDDIQQPPNAGHVALAHETSLPMKLSPTTSSLSSAVGTIPPSKLTAQPDQVRPVISIDFDSVVPPILLSFSKVGQYLPEGCTIDDSEGPIPLPLKPMLVVKDQMAAMVFEFADKEPKKDESGQGTVLYRIGLFTFASVHRLGHWQYYMFCLLFYTYCIIELMKS